MIGGIFGATGFLAGIITIIAGLIVLFKPKIIAWIVGIYLIIVGGIASIMYSSIYLTWFEATNASWGNQKHHHLLVTVTPTDAKNLTQLINQARTNSGVVPDL